MRHHFLGAIIPCLLASCAAKLAPDSTGDGQAGVHIGVERGRVVLDLLDVETIASIGAVDDQAGLEGALEAADAVLAALAGRVGESEAATGNMSVPGRQRSMDWLSTYRGGPLLPRAPWWM